MTPLQFDELDSESLKRALSYDPVSGLFVWRIRPARNVLIGAVAGCIDSVGYTVIRLQKNNYKSHRLAWLYMHGAWPTDQIDHINHIKHDNRISNLRDVSHAVNQQNKIQANRTSKLGILGVSRVRNKFRALIRVNEKYKFLGVFTTPQEASQAYWKEKQVAHPGAVASLDHVYGGHDE